METSYKSLVQEKKEMLQDLDVSSVLTPLNPPQYVTVTSLCITDMPDSILLHIFANLPFSSIGVVAQVCNHWHQITQDELLWKDVFLKHYRLPKTTVMPASYNSWQQEFKRLHYYTPAVLLEERKEHRDEVLHVSFSNNGKMFATCSKDGYFKVWKKTHPSQLVFMKDMKSSFNWKFTQFSQFNTSDTCLLVSGVYIGDNSTSGEIAVFNIYDDFRLQCRVTNKPYDVFGAWFDDDHLLSGTLYWTGVMNSVSAIWLSKASQEVEAEMESVSMMLYRFENVNSSSIRLLNVAEVNQDNDDADITLQGKINTENLTNQDMATSDRLNLTSHQVKDKFAGSSSLQNPDLPRPHQKTSYFLDRLLRKSIAEDEFDMENEDKTDDEEQHIAQKTNGKNTFINASQIKEKLSNICDSKPNCDLFDISKRNFPTSAEISQADYLHTEYSNSMSSLPSKTVEISGAAAAPLSSGDCEPELNEGMDTFCVNEQPQQSFVEEENMITIEKNETFLCASSVENSVSTSSINCSSLLDQNKSVNFFPSSGICENSHTTVPTSRSEVNNNNNISPDGEQRQSDQNQSLHTEWPMLVHNRRNSTQEDYTYLSHSLSSSDSDVEMHQSVGTQTASLPPVNPPHNPAFESLVCQKPIVPEDLRRPPREKLLIYTWGSETYIPHKIGIKRMRYSEFSKGEVTARSGAMLLPDVMANIHNAADHRRDSPDHTIEMHGHIVGLSLSPDHRHLYVNCRPWPKDYIISDPQESPPLAQEVEISAVDLKTFEFVGPVLRSHRAFTHSDECFFLNLDVSQEYVVSGAENCRGYLWDRHYGLSLFEFPHRNVVNCAAVCPSDPEMVVTVSDDHTFKVWTSRHRAKMLSGQT